VKDITRRVHRWRKKFTPDKQRATIADIYDDMAQRYEAAMTAVCIMEEKVKQTLDAQGVHTSFYVPYLDFARQLFKLSRQQAISGDSLALAAKVLLDKWVARGADVSVLAAIRSEVFNVSEPSP
jgi:hypothetical protein